MQAFYEFVIFYLSNIVGVVLSAPAKKLNLRHLRFLRTNKACFKLPGSEGACNASLMQAYELAYVAWMKRSVIRVFSIR